MVESDERALRILIEHSDYWLANKGDLAMLDVTIDRLLRHWPTARIGVLTETPALLRAYFPQAEPVTPWGRSPWGRPTVAERLSVKLGPRAAGPLAIGWITSRVQAQLTARWVRDRLRTYRARQEDRVSTSSTTPEASGEDDAREGHQSIPPNTAAAVRTASLVLALGGGYLTDADPVQSRRVLALLEHARTLGIPSALVGQGLGPIEDPDLLSRVAAVLPQVDFIGLRESRRGPELLTRAGVAMERVMVTGDDAIALAQSVRRDTIGSDIGICLRIAGYSPVTDRARDDLRQALQAAAQEHRARLVPVIIAEYKSEDRRSTLPLVGQDHPASRPPGRFSPSRDIAVQVGGCRVLVTGAYHAAVFALAQGIPVVALSSSRYYDDKFLGLADMFGGGVRLIALDGDHMSSELHRAVREAWQEASDLRLTLRARANEQIARSEAGIERVVTLVNAACQGRTSP